MVIATKLVDQGERDLARAFMDSKNKISYDTSRAGEWVILNSHRGDQLLLAKTSFSVVEVYAHAVVSFPLFLSFVRNMKLTVTL